MKLSHIKMPWPVNPVNLVNPVFQCLRRLVFQVTWTRRADGPRPETGRQIARAIAAKLARERCEQRLKVSGSKLQFPKERTGL